MSSTVVAGAFPVLLPLFSTSLLHDISGINTPTGASGTWDFSFGTGFASGSVVNSCEDSRSGVELMASCAASWESPSGSLDII